MITDFPVDIISQYGSQVFIGDAVFSTHMKMVHLVWNPNGMVVANDSTTIVIETDNEKITASPGVLVPWEKFSPTWIIRFPNSATIATGSVQYFNSIRQLLARTSELSDSIMVAGIKHLIPKHAGNIDLSWDFIREIDLLASHFTPQQRKEIEDVLKPYRIQEALKTMLAPNPPKEAISFLYSVFK